jgi:hypothetical protein
VPVAIAPRICATEAEPAVDTAEIPAGADATWSGATAAGTVAATAESAIAEARKLFMITLPEC